jgi:hypothetical protein
LLGLLARPELYDSYGLLRTGDSLILFTDGVTEARSPIDRDLFGDDRLHDLIASLRDLSAEQIADAIQQASLTFSGGRISDDTVALVLTVPPVRDESAARVRGRLACGAAAPGGRRRDPTGMGSRRRSNGQAAGQRPGREGRGRPDRTAA